MTRLRTYQEDRPDQAGFDSADFAAIQAHLQSAHFLQMDQTTAGWVRSKEVRKLQRTAP